MWTMPKVQMFSFKSVNLNYDKSLETPDQNLKTHRSCKSPVQKMTCIWLVAGANFTVIGSEFNFIIVVPLSNFRTWHVLFAIYSVKCRLCMFVSVLSYFQKSVSGGLWSLSAVPDMSALRPCCFILALYSLTTYILPLLKERLHRKLVCMLLCCISFLVFTPLSSKPPNYCVISHGIVFDISCK